MWSQHPGSSLPSSLPMLLCEQYDLKEINFVDVLLIHIVHLKCPYAEQLSVMCLEAPDNACVDWLDKQCHVWLEKFEVNIC